MKMQDPMYPAGVDDSDPYFDLPNAGRRRGSVKVLGRPKTVMVWCIECQRWWKASATEDYWKARTEPCPEHQKG